MSNWLLTGSSGFIGKSFVTHLLNSGHNVTALVINSRGKHPSIPFISIDNIKNLEQNLAGKKFDFVVNFAASGVHPDDRNIGDHLTYNINLPVQLLNCKELLGNPVYFLAGSCSEYADREGKLHESASLNVNDLYAASKAAGGLASIAAAKQIGASCVWGRIFNVIGYGEAPHRLIPSLVTAYKANQPFAMSDGLQIRDLIAITDVVEVIYKVCIKLSLEVSPTAAFMNISSGIGHSVKDVASAACEAISGDVTNLKFGELKKRAGEISQSIGDNTTLINKIGHFEFLPILEYVKSYSQNLYKD